MFTGLIETTGVVKRIDVRRGGCRLSIEATAQLVSALTLGESISVDGACLTVVQFADQHFVVEATSETLKCTTLGTLLTGAPVHLERAMTLGGRMGGHWVTGHIDGIGAIRSKTQAGAGLVMSADGHEAACR